MTARLQSPDDLEGLAPQEPDAKRRTKADIARWRRIVCEIVTETHPMGVRQVFYQLVAYHGLEKSELSYRFVGETLLTPLRRAGVIPFDWIDDGATTDEPWQCDSPGEALDDTADQYRRCRWASQRVLMGVFLEKDGLRGSIRVATEPLFVPIWSGGGSASLSMRHRCAEYLVENANGRPCHIFQLADHDPHGRDIARSVASPGCRRADV